MPTRSKRFLAGVVTGYGSIATNILFTLTSVPLALHYLDKEHFGLWALAAQVNGYLALIDLGMSAAVSRFVADHKDDVNGGDYGSHLLTGGIVFTIQGFMIAAVGVGFSWFAPGAFAIPTHLAVEFRNLLIILSITAGASVAIRSISAPLWAFQRSDVVNACASLTLIANLALLWFGFKSGWGVMSFAIAPIPPIFATFGIYAWVCHRNHLYPSVGHWGKPNFAVFKRVFAFGKDTVLITLGSQLINASQIMIISRWIGLDAAATFSVATKFYAMAMLLVVNPVAASAPGLAELHVRGEQERFVRRYWDLILVIIAIATVSACCLAAGNNSMITIWTHGNIHWTWLGDLMLGLLVVMRNINGCFIGLFGLVKNYRPVRLILFAEGVFFVPTAIFSAIHFGLLGVLAAALVAHLLVNTPMSARAATAILGPCFRLINPLICSLVLISVSGLLGWASGAFSLNPYLTLALTAVMALVAALGAWFFILSEMMRSETLGRLNGAALQLRKLCGIPSR